MVGCSAAIGYVVDAHRQSADSALGGVILYVYFHHIPACPRAKTVYQLQEHIFLYHHAIH